jgi:hypothetical protein
VNTPHFCQSISRRAFAIANQDFVKGFEHALEDFRERSFPASSEAMPGL